MTSLSTLTCLINQGVPWKPIAIVFVLVCSCSILIIFLRIYFWKVYKEVLSYCPSPDFSVLWSHGHNLNTFQHQVALMVLSNFLIMFKIITIYSIMWVLDKSKYGYLKHSTKNFKIKICYMIIFLKDLALFVENKRYFLCWNQTIECGLSSLS